MTWKEFKNIMNGAKVKDDDVINYFETLDYPEPDDLSVFIDEINGKLREVSVCSKLDPVSMD